MDNKNLDRLLEKLWPYRNGTVKFLESWDCNIDSLTGLINTEHPPTSFQIKLKYKNIPPNEKVIISKNFNEEILPLFSSQHWDTVRKAMRL